MVVDDFVMGGRSNGNIKLSEKGNLLFHGEISLENNGGFSLIRRSGLDISLVEYSRLVCVLKGDGKSYQLRLKSRPDEEHSYIAVFTTSGDWEEISIPLSQFLPSYRGKLLNLQGFAGESLSEVGFLIGNQKEETFHLEIAKIGFK